jgi:hypothetical protein
VQLRRTFGRSKEERLDRKTLAKRKRRSRETLKLSLPVENGASIFVLFIDLSTLKLSYLNLHVSVLSTLLHCLFTVLSGFFFFFNAVLSGFETEMREVFGKVNIPST